METLINALIKHGDSFHSVIPAELQHSKSLCLNLSEDSEFADIDIEDTQALEKKAKELLKKHNAKIAIGKYAENRPFYKNRERFEGVQRSVHLGIDLMVEPGTPVYTPMPAIVHSFKDNNEIGDYGPTVVLQHELDNIIFYTLFGHLSRESLKSLKKNQTLTHGEQFSSVGDSHENGKWPPHLHFQIIADIGDYEGDFPGVANVLNQQEFLSLCPNPNYILNLKLA